MKKITDRLNSYMDFKGLNPNKVTVDAGLSVGLIGKSIKKSSGLNSDTIEKILCAYSDLNPIWFVLGEGEMLKKDSLKIELEVDYSYKELAEARLEIIEGLKFKIMALEKDLSKFKFSEKESFLHKSVAEPTPELSKKEAK